MPRNRDHKTSKESNRSRDLLVVDDAKIREEAYAFAKEAIEGLERFQREQAAFREKDQQLYDEWLDLTFRSDREEIDSLHEELNNLHLRTDRYLALALWARITPAEAYLRVTLEEQQLRECNQEIRTSILRTWDERERHYQRRIEKEEQAARERARERRKKRQEAEERRWQRQWEKAKKAREDYLRSLAEQRGPSREQEDDQEIQQEDPLSASKIDGAGSGEGDGFDPNGEDCACPICAAMARGDDPSDEDWERAGYQSFEWANSGSPKDSAAETERLKIAYRKLVKVLHPDKFLASGGKIEGWRQLIWDYAQNALGSGDRHYMEAMLAMAYLRLGRLNDLTLDEIREGAEWFINETRALKWRSAAQARSPAWGFSSRKNLGRLQGQIRRKLNTEKRKLKDLINGVKRRHSWLLEDAMELAKKQISPPGSTPENDR